MRKRPCFTARSNLKCGNSNSHLSLGRAGVYARAGCSYLRSLLYDKFEQRVFVEQGNGVKTAYSYDAKTRRLNNLTAQKSSGELFQNLAYSYDKVGNILGLANNVAVPPPNVFGGPTNQSFAYDDLYRLTHAEGTFQFSPSKSHTYTMDMVYDTIHNIALKNQLHTIIQPSTQAVTQKKTSYNFAYAYNPSGANSVRPHAPTHIDLRTYSYDLDGNQTGWTHDTNGTRRTITWDDENRIQNVADNGQTKDYKYDDQGQRMIKRGPQGETVYVNQFFTQRPGATGTKHVYAGTSRIASKLVRQDTPNSNPSGNTPFEKDLYFFHPDHIGSTNYVTDLNGKLYEHLEYFPFGEAWVEENSNQQRTPFLFSAKELDEETGLYYFGARYYDPRTSVWQSADPILAKYLPSGDKDKDQHLPGMGGIYTSFNINLYAYGHTNPVRYTDPDGKVTADERRKAIEVVAAYVAAEKVNRAQNPGTTTYEYGGKGAPGSGITCDCSGVTAHAYPGLPAGTTAQRAATTEVSLPQVIPGDLVFFYQGGHTGVVTDVQRDQNGNVTKIRFGHTTGSQGAHYNDIRPSDPGSYWNNNLQSIRTFKPETDPLRPNASLSEKASHYIGAITNYLKSLFGGDN